MPIVRRTDTVHPVLQAAIFRRIRHGFATWLVLALIAVSAGFALGPATATAETTSTVQTIYVDGANGIDFGGPWTDFQGCGSSASPCASISYGLRLAERVPEGGPGAAVVIRVAAGTYVETLTVHVPRNRLVIEGTGTTVIDGDGQGSTVRVQIGEVTLSGLTITGGDAHGDGTSGLGGGLYVAGEGSTVVDGTTWDGNANVTVTDSTITGNRASLAGAGVADLGSLKITRSTVTANGPSGGYAVFNASYMTIDSSTIAANLTSGAIVNAKFAAVRSSTVSGGSVDSNGDESGALFVDNSILSGSTCEYLAGSHNVVTDTSCMLSDGTLSTVAGIGLAPLAANGSTGPQTMAIDQDSAAHLTVPEADCDATDQRGQPRPGGGSTITSCDAGAYELQYVPGPPPEVHTNVYVDAATGSNANTCLTAAVACESIAAGLERAAPLFGDSTGDITVHIAAGTYDEKLQIDAPDGRRLKIAGAGAARTVVKGVCLCSVVTVDSGEVELNGLTITGGVSDTGGGLSVGAAAVVDVVDSAVTDHHVADDPSDDAIVGGGIQSLGTLSLIRSTVSGNSSQSGPGAIYAAGPLTVTESTVADNDGRLDAKWNYAHVAILPVDGATITSSTISTSSGTFNIYPMGARKAIVSRSILSGGNCSINLFDGGYNVVTDADCVFSDTRTLSTVAGIGLAPLAANGSTGPETMAIHLSSAAHMAVPAAMCDATDQRGQSRPGAASASLCDAGAYELHFVPGAHFYVDASIGFDTNACRTPATACATVKAAMARVDLSFQGGVSDIELSIGAGVYIGTVRTSPPAGHILSIDGAGAQRTFLDGYALGTTLTISGGEVDVRRLSITSGRAHNGGGVSVGSGAKAQLTGVQITGNSADYGGGIFSYGLLNITGSTINDNQAHNTGTELVSYGQAEITSSTIVGDGSSPMITTGAATINSSTLSGGRLIGPMTVSRSILSGAPCTDVIDGGYNVVTDSGCVDSDTSVVSTVAGIGLEPLAANGSTGPQTMAIHLSSTAHLVVPESKCDATDQRGQSRPGAASSLLCDAGAYELHFAAGAHFYVDASTGFDTNDCRTPATACATVTAAMARVDLSFQGGVSDIELSIAAGAYSETAHADPPAGHILSIDGAGARSTVLDGNAHGTTLIIGGGEVDVRDLTITGGQAHDGGGVFVDADAKAQLTDVHVTGNSADYGGGIFSYGPLNITGSTINDNRTNGPGTAVAAQGQVEITSSTIVGDGSHLTITANGAIASSTISGGGIGRFTGTLSVSRSILSDAPCAVGVLDGGHNVVTDSDCVTTDTSTVSTVAGVDLAPLAYYGGPTPTTPPASDSTAVQPAHRIPSGAAGCPLASSPGVDQRGAPRPVDGGCDVGAVELIASSVTVDADASTTTASVTAATEGPAGRPAPAGTVTFADDDGTIPGCATVALAGDTATCPHGAVGTAVVTYTSHNGYRTSSAGAGAVARIAITPGSATISLGTGQTVTVTGYNASIEPLGEVTAAATLTITPDGSCSATACTPASGGAHTVTATFGSLRATASLNVIAPSVGLPVTVPTNIDALINVPDQTVAGQSIVVFGSGFAPNSPVLFGIYSPATPLTETTAGVDGTVNATLTIPVDFVGAHTIVAAGTAGGAPIYLAARTMVSAPPDSGGVTGPTTSPSTVDSSSTDGGTDTVTGPSTGDTAPAGGTTAPPTHALTTDGGTTNRGTTDGGRTNGGGTNGGTTDGDAGTVASPSSGNSATAGGTTATPTHPRTTDTTTSGVTAGDTVDSALAPASNSSTGIANGLLWSAALIVIGAVLAIVVWRRSSR